MPATSLLITAQRMRQEQEHGRVRALHPDIPEFCRWFGTWWIQSPDPAGWLRVTDAHLASRLDRIKTRLDIAEDNLACEKAIRENQEDNRPLPRRTSCHPRSAPSSP